MKELVVLSGKGGTGKTSLTAAFANLAKKSAICDADVDAADLHLLLNPQIKTTTTFQGGYEARIDLNRCTSCGLCLDLCHFQAISQEFVVDGLNCEGCGVCVDMCPIQAIEFPLKNSGKWFSSETRFGPMVHASLGIAQENSGKLVTLVRQEARKVAQERDLEQIIIDGPPGVGCSVIASLTGASAVVIVAEPSLSGVHDMKRVLQLTSKLGVPAMVCVNKYDLNPELSAGISQEIKKQHLVFLGNIPYDPDLTKAMIKSQTIIEYAPDSPTSKAVIKIWESIERFQGMQFSGITPVRN